ncbi:hypothetical protein OPT61_g3040 [Boeremia exigua]|uniref:Uncharacterized protein n=1 Tax=Boeremia exigua TaxID=749465 RepID=A0ACC2IJH4_9PLEO|nr:hypothetical protein OPT61_g3040 [Boeremia exigua]
MEVSSPSTDHSHCNSAMNLVALATMCLYILLTWLHLASTAVTIPPRKINTVGTLSFNFAISQLLISIISSLQASHSLLPLHIKASRQPPTTIAPSRRDNPAPRFDSNTPQALADLPVFNAYEDPRWTHLARDSQATERTPLLARGGAAWAPTARPVAPISPRTAEMSSSGDSSLLRELMGAGDDECTAALTRRKRVCILAHLQRSFNFSNRGLPPRPPHPPPRSHLQPPVALLAALSRLSSLLFIAPASADPTSAGTIFRSRLGRLRAVLAALGANSLFRLRLIVLHRGVRMFVLVGNLNPYLGGRPS